MDEPVDDINLDVVAELMSGNQPMACCPRDGEPLIMTFEFMGAEFICGVCNTKFGFLSPRPEPWTQSLQDRHDELKILYDLARLKRSGA